MATIPNFPQDLLNEHAAWHRNMPMGMRSGMGIDFLEFHRNYLQKSLAWYGSQRGNPQLVAPWSSIPSEIKNHPRWNRSLQNAETRIVGNLTSFSSADELGGFILATGLHDFIHVMGAQVYNDADFEQIALAPRSTLFYNWHGLIDRWYRQLEQS